MSDLDDDTYGDEPAPQGHNNPPKTFEDELRAEHADVFLRLEALKLARGKLPAVVNSEDDNAAVGRWAVEARAVVNAAEAAHKKAKKPIAEKVAAIDGLFLSKGVVGEIKKLTAVVQALADDYATRKEAERRRQLQAEAERQQQLAEEAAYEAQALRDAGSHSAAEVVTSQAEHTEKRAERLEAKAQGGAAEVLRTRHEGVTASGRTKWAYEIEDLEKIDFNVLRDTIYGHELSQLIQRYVDGGGRDLPGVRIFERVIATFR